MAKIRGSTENWENGKLGVSEAHAVRTSAADTATIEKAAGHGLKAVSMRLPADLIARLKEIARHHGVGYQPMVRDLLARWATGEIRTILEARLKDNERREDEYKKGAPLAPPLKRRA